MEVHNVINKCDFVFSKKLTFATKAKLPKLPSSLEMHFSMQKYRPQKYHSTIYFTK